MLGLHVERIFLEQAVVVAVEPGPGPTPVCRSPAVLHGWVVVGVEHDDLLLGARDLVLVVGVFGAVGAVLLAVAPGFVLRIVAAVP